MQAVAGRVTFRVDFNVSVLATSAQCSRWSVTSLWISARGISGSARCKRPWLASLFVQISTRYNGVSARCKRWRVVSLFMQISTCGTSGYVSCSLNLYKWRLFMLICFIKRCLFVDLCQIWFVVMTKQMSDAKKVDITSSSVDIICEGQHITISTSLLNISLYLPPYSTYHYIYLLTVWYFYNIKE